MEAQNIEQGLAAHVAQQDSEGQGGDRRAEHHQHIYFISHKGPSVPSLVIRPSCIVLRTLNSLVSRESL
jgi:hypothetical protein